MSLASHDLCGFLATNMIYVVTYTHLINLQVLQSHEIASFQPTNNNSLPTNSIYITHHALDAVLLALITF